MCVHPQAQPSFYSLCPAFVSGYYKNKNNPIVSVSEREAGELGGLDKAKPKLTHRKRRKKLLHNLPAPGISFLQIIRKVKCKMCHVKKPYQNKLP